MPGSHCVVADHTTNHDLPAMHVPPQQMNVKTHTFLYRPQHAVWLLHTRPQRLIIIHQQPIAQSWVRCEIQAGEELKHKASFVMHQLDGWRCVNNQSSMRIKKLSDLPFYVFSNLLIAPCPSPHLPYATCWTSRHLLGGDVKAWTVNLFTRRSWILDSDWSVAAFCGHIVLYKTDCYPNWFPTQMCYFHLLFHFLIQINISIHLFIYLVNAM